MSRFLNIGGTLRNSFEKNELQSIIFFVTSACNQKCAHCFNWQNLNRQGDLRLEEIEKISLNLPRFSRLLMSGGEPFLRKELPDIVRLFYRNNNIEAVVIPSNGTLTSIIVPAMRTILEISARLNVSVCFSLDGLAESHDSLRGMKGSFEKSLTSIRMLGELKREYGNLSINVASTITAHNMNEIKKLIDFIRAKDDNVIEMHYFDVVRDSPCDPSVKNLNGTELKNLFENTILPYQEEQTRELKKAGYGFVAPLIAKMEMSMVAHRYKMQYEHLFQGKTWGRECQAGRSIMVIDSNGNLSSCESRPSLANVRKINYDFQDFIHSEKFQSELEYIRKSGCSCTHSAFLTKSVFKSPKLVLLTWPLLFLKSLVRSAHRL
jgi:MoaA/NifB/PqqE/SkfB family radical SAM enzyme